MIAQHPVGPGPSWKSTFIRIDDLANSTGLRVWHCNGLDSDTAMNLIELLAVLLVPTLHWQIEFADEHALAIAIHDGTHLSHDLVYARLVSRVAAQPAISGWITWLPLRIHRVIAELLILEQTRECVNAEAIDPSVQPEAQDIIHRLAHLLIAPIQIRLFHIEQVQVILPGVFIELPGRLAKPAHPVIGGTAIGGWVSPDVPGAFLVGAALPCLLEPGMLIGGMIRHKIQNDLEVTLVGLLKQGVQVRQGAEERINIGVIGNVIAKIRHGRRVDEREPESVNAEPVQIV